MLRSEKFHQDPRVKQAKDLIRETLKEHQSTLTEIKPADLEKQADYDKLIEKFNKLRGNNIWYPFIGSGFGHGPLVELLDGSIKYDFISGIGVHYFGHSNSEIMATGLEAALSDTVMEGNLQQNEDSIELTSTLVKLSGLPHCFLSTSGAMANENAFKIALQKNHPKARILAFEHCFAGRTLALSQVTDKPAYREGLPLNIEVDYIPFYDVENPQKSLENSLRAIKNVLARYPGQHAVMILELVQGEGGCYPGAQEFFVPIVDLLREHKIAVYIDEVQSFGRTPSLFAFQHFGLEGKVDIVSIGKLSQICATLFTSEWAPKAGLLSQTFTSSVSAIKAGQYILDTLSTQNYFGETGRLNHIQKTFKKHFEDLQKKYPNKIKGPWGIGAMIAFTYQAGEAKETLEFSRRLFAAGLITFVAGAAPTRIRMLPPALVITDEDINAACRIIESCL